MNGRGSHSAVFDCRAMGRRVAEEIAMNMKKTDFTNTTILACFALLTFIVPVRAQAPVEFANPGPITIHTPRFPRQDGSVAPFAASPYPSTINVSGFAANEVIDKITVTLHDLSHETPDDIDVLLVGPTGQNIILLSDAGGGFVHPGFTVTVTLDDDAQELVPDDDAIVSGIFKPSNHEVDDEDLADVFPEPLDENDFPTGPAPEPSLATTLYVFSGTHPNGEWLLYVVDDDVFDAGSIAKGWSLTIRTGTPSTPFLRGDSNEDGALNITDVVATLASLFQGGARPACADAADADDNGSVSLTDAVYTLQHLFRGGLEPPAPGTGACGGDPSEDGLSCGSFLPCQNRCFGGQLDCDGVCREVHLDPQNCGACGVVCPPGMNCAGGRCQDAEPCCGL
jgi:subtilisin-like proprotein convertase family protein